MFIQYLVEDPQWYLMVVTTVVISIVLHELAHGWSAIWQGDDTPIHTKRMTGNPLVHLGPFSIAALFLCGIAWGQMPVDPTRFRSRYGEAIVSAAGPATNLLLATIALTGLGLWARFGINDQEVPRNIVRFLYIFGSTNLLLCLFNLMPAPPLDGSHILANFHQGYADFVHDPSRQGVFIIMFMFVFAVSGVLLGWVYGAARDYTSIIAGSDEFIHFIW